MAVCNQIPCELSSDSLAIIAVYKKQWTVVSYYHTEHKLTSAAVNMLFETAANQGCLSNIPAFWKGEYLMPDRAILLKQFQVSVKNNYLDNIPCFFACPDFNKAIKNPGAPLIKKLAVAFNYAVNQQYFEMVKLIAEGSVGKILQSTINQTLKDAARLGQCEVLKNIRQLRYNGPGQRAMEASLFRAVRANQLSAVKELVVFSVNSPRLQVIYEASQEAKKKRLPEIEVYLSNLYKKNSKSSEKNDRKSTDSLNQLHSTSLKKDLGRAVSCRSMSSLSRHSYFSSSRSASVSPIPEKKHEFNKECTFSRTLSYKDVLMS